VGYVWIFQQIFYRAPRRFAAKFAWSQMAFAAVVPSGGASGIAVGAWIVKAKGGSVSRYVQRSAVLFLLTSAINVATLAVVGLLAGIGLLALRHQWTLGFIPGLVGLCVIVFFLCIPLMSRRLPPGSKRWKTVVKLSGAVVDDTVAEMRYPSWRMIGAVTYLWFDIAALWACLLAVGAEPSLGLLVLAYLIGYLGNIIPVPGGIGVLDGGLVAAFVLYGIKAAPATAGVLIYHALVLWIPTLIGSFTFLSLRKTIDQPLQLRPERVHWRN
jgi:uncharacterized membrane protein YbhN (UPF0104 family)